MQDALYTENLAVGYSGQVLIEDICLHLRRGEIMTLIGPNGSGKSTILRSVIRQISPIRGAVYLDGRPIDRMTALETAKRLSVLMTDRVHPELMTCRDVTATGRYPYTGKLGLLTAEDWEKVDGPGFLPDQRRTAPANSPGPGDLPGAGGHRAG